MGEDDAVGDLVDVDEQPADQRDGEHGADQLRDEKGRGRGGCDAAGDLRHHLPRRLLISEAAEGPVGATTVHPAITFPATTTMRFTPHLPRPRNAGGCRGGPVVHRTFDPRACGQFHPYDEAMRSQVKQGAGICPQDAALPVGNPVENWAEKKG